VTAVATINYSATKVPAMIVFKGAYHLHRHFKNNLNSNILFTRSATGFTNKQLALCYIKHFDRFCPPSCPSRYRILIFDSYRSHLSNDFLDYCWEHCIQPYKLPAHTTHLLQPLNVAVFQALKH
jgi:DDE superfamily endonuclease